MSQIPITMFYSHKGGTGKTTSLLNVAAILARTGQRVGMVDLDFEAPALGPLNDIDISKHDLLRLMAEQSPVAEVERHVVAVNLAPNAQVHCLPSSGDLELIQRCKWMDSGTFTYLQQVLKAFQTSFDLQHLLLDTRSGVSPQMAFAIRGATHAVIACRLDRQSRLGASRLRTICQARRLAYSLVIHAVPLKNPKLAPALISFQAEVGQPHDVLIPYDPRLYFEETIVEAGNPAKPTPIYQAYASITQRIQGIP